MSLSPPVIQPLPMSVEDSPAFVRVLEEFDLPPGDLFLLPLIQRLDLYQRRAIVRQIRLLLKDK